MGCAIHDSYMTTDNSIKGTVRDRKGRVVIDARVALIDFDHPQRDPREEIRGWREFTQKKTGRFEFKGGDRPLPIDLEPRRSRRRPA